MNALHPIPRTAAAGYAPGFYPAGPGLGVVPNHRHGRLAGIPAEPNSPFPVSSGRPAADTFDPLEEEAYWQTQCETEPYFGGGSDYNDYRPAYRAGFLGFVAHAGSTWAEAEGLLERAWVKTKGSSRLTWYQAKPAVRAAWRKLEQSACPGGVAVSSAA